MLKVLFWYKTTLRQEFGISLVLYQSNADAKQRCFVQIAQLVLAWIC